MGIEIGWAETKIFMEGVTGYLHDDLQRIRSRKVGD